MVETIPAENRYSLIVTVDFNRPPPRWWAGDIQQPEGTALGELIDVNNLHLCQNGQFWDLSFFLYVLTTWLGILDVI